MVNEINFDPATETFLENCFFTRVNKEIISGETFNIGATTANKLAYIYKRLVTAINPNVANLDLTVRLYEDSVFTGGTNATTFNKNRNNTKNSTLLFQQGVTVTTLGTLIGKLDLKDIVNKKTENIDIIQYITKKNTKYLVQVVNNTAQTVSFEIVYDIIEK